MIDAQLQENVTLTPEQFAFLEKKSRKHDWWWRVLTFSAIYSTFFWGGLATMHTFTGEPNLQHIVISGVSAVLMLALTVPYLRTLNAQHVFREVYPELLHALWSDRKNVDLNDFETRTADIPKRYDAWLRARDEETS